MTTSPKTKRLFGLALVFALVLGFAGVASADDFVSSDPGPITTTTTVSISLVAVPGEVPSDNGDGCNIGNASDSHTVTAAIESSDTAVATVDPSSMTFETCGVGQNLTITVYQQVCNASATVTISEQSVYPNDNSIKGAFNTETLIVNSAGSNNADPSCTGGGGGTSICAEPAAPAWAAALLKASGIKAKQTTLSNYISSVAEHMGPQTEFDGTPKSAVGPGTGDAYPNAVRDYMVNTLGLTTLADVDSARLIRPGWDCVPIT